MKCSKCGKMVSSDEKFCKYCGNNVRGMSEKKPDNTLAIISIVFGVLSLLIGAFFFPIAIIGLVLGLCQKEKSSLKTTGIVLNVIGLIIAVIALVLVTIFAVNIFHYVEDKGGINNVIEDIIDDNGVVIDGEGVTSTWDVYPELRSGELGKKLNIEGTWRILGESKIGYIFNDGKACRYEDINNKEDNYSCGEYTAKSKMDLDDIEWDSIIKKYLNIDVYKITINMSEKTINGDTIVDNNKDEYTWVLINHQEEGIEALEKDSLSDGSNSYVKIAD